MGWPIQTEDKKMKKLLFLSICISQIFCAEVTSERTQKEKDILEFIRVSTMQPEQIDALIPVLVQGIIAFSQQEIDAEQLATKAKTTLLSEGFLEQFIPAFDKAFTHEEIQQLVSYFKSSAMRKYYKHAQETCGQVFIKINPMIQGIANSMANPATPRKDDRVLTISNDNYQTEIEESDLPVLVDVYSSFCPPCQTLAPIFSELSDQYAGNIKFAKINVDEELALCQKLKIHSMPTLVFMKNGKILERHVGLIDKENLVKKIDSTFKE
jgi:thioredoxin 1